MTKNDYRRALIMLRAVQNGLVGHVRLERRTLMGSMQFSLSGLPAEEELQAAMAAKTDSGWKIVHIGTLGQDRRGRAGLNWTFDPRSIEGLPLERYSVLLILQVAPGICQTAMTGYVNGAVQVDWERVEQAACAAYTGCERRLAGTQCADSPNIEVAPPQSSAELDAPAELLSAQGPAEPTGLDGPAEDVEPAEFDLAAAAGVSAEPDGFDEPARQCAGTAAKAGASPAVQIPEEPTGFDGPSEGVELAALDLPAAAARTALQALGADAEQRWPEGIEPLRAAFSAAEPVFLSALPDHVFIHAFHSAQCPQCAVGLRAEGGRPVSVAWAIPGEKAETPPQGLEGYVWKDGWWLAVADAESGAYRVIAPQPDIKLT